MSRSTAIFDVNSVVFAPFAWSAPLGLLWVFVIGLSSLFPGVVRRSLKDVVAYLLECLQLPVGIQIPLPPHVGVGHSDRE